jgi:hypothetical protein
MPAGGLTANPSSSASQAREICGVCPIDGGPRQRLINLHGRPGRIFASMPAPSPDGKYVYFGWYEAFGDLWIADLVSL